MLKPIYGVPGLLYNPESGAVVKLVRGEKKDVPTFYKEGEEYLTLPNGRPVRVKSLLKGGQR